MLRRLLSARSSGLGLRWRPGSIVGLAPSFTSAAASGGSGGSGSGNVPPPAHPHAPIHWKGHNLKPLRIKKRGIEVVQVRGCSGGWLVDEPCVALGGVWLRQACRPLIPAPPRPLLAGPAVQQGHGLRTRGAGPPQHPGPPAAAPLGLPDADIAGASLECMRFNVCYGHGRDKPGALLMMDHTHTSWRG